LTQQNYTNSGLFIGRIKHASDVSLLLMVEYHPQISQIQQTDK